MLNISDLSKTYAKGVRALSGVTLSVGHGLFGLLGPNGAGKSTLMRTLATLQEPDTGTIHFGDRDVLRDPATHRRHLGYLPQDFDVYPGISATALLDHLAVLKGITSKSDRHAQVNALLLQTNLHQHRNKSVSGFSGGMKQRFGVAQALLGNPELLIVDEPTAGLDPEERNRFHNLLGEIGENVVVILSTHIVEDVRQLCPRMAILAGGQVVSEGDPARLCAALDGRIWRRIVARETLARYRATVPVLSERLSAGKTVLRVIADAAPDTGFVPAEPELEDVYFAALAARPAA
jgi:ABC-type multidrug transport system ATPase subunit